MLLDVWTQCWRFVSFVSPLRMSATGAPNIKHHRSLHKYDVFDSRIPVLIVHTGLCMPRVLCVHVNKQA